jgi:hypothetical protein
MANCLKCGAKCAVHALGIEKDAMKEKPFIDCKTFKPLGKGQTTKDQIIPNLGLMMQNLCEVLEEGDP